MDLTKDEELKFPTWSGSKHLNRWADYVELLCIFGEDHLVTIDDIIDYYLDMNPEEAERGSTDHSQKYDNFRRNVEIYFALLANRAEFLKDDYPFEIEGKKSLQLKVGLNSRHIFYVFLLCASNTFCFKSMLSRLTSAFEEICLPILKIVSSRISTTEIFGTSRAIEEGAAKYCGNLKKRLKTLARELGTGVTPMLENDTKFDVPCGDGGIDLVSYIDIDGHPCVPLILAQCACGYEEWVDKQDSIQPSVWNRRYLMLAPYIQVIFVPFFVRNSFGEFEHLTDIRTCVFDRARIFLLAQRTDSVFSEFLKSDIYVEIVKFLTKKDIAIAA